MNGRNMGRVVLGSVIAALLLAAPSIRACGDKYLVADVTSGQDSITAIPLRGKVVFFARADAAELDSSDLVGALRESGLEIALATNEAELAAALNAGAVDLVLADYEEAVKLDVVVRSGSPTSRIVPILDRAQRSKMTEAKRAFTHVLNVPAKLSRVLGVIRGALQAV